MGYRGSKSGAGVYQTIINQMPPHETYIEPFVGGGALFLRKKPARTNIAVDLDERAVTELKYLAFPILGSSKHSCAFPVNAS